MKDKVVKAFDAVKAEPALTEKTRAYLHGEMRRQSTPRPRKQTRLAAVLASLLVFVLAGGGMGYLYFTPAAYIDLDVNPSLELTVNRFGRVIASAAYNDEASQVLSATSVQNKAYAEAVDGLLDKMIAQAYLAPEGLVCVTIQAGQAEMQQKLLSGVETAVASSLSGHHTSAVVEVSCVTAEIKEGAASHHVSPARYMAITELQSVDGTVSFESCTGDTIGELRQQTQAHGAAHHGNEHH